MGHESAKKRRKRLKAARAAGNPILTAARRKAKERGRDSGGFSETGFVDERKRTTAEALRDIRIQEKIPGTIEATARDFSTNIALGTVGGRAGGFRGSVFQTGARSGAAKAGVAARARGFIPSARSIAKVAGGAALGAAATSVLEQVIPGGAISLPHRDTGKSIATLPGVGGLLPAKDTVVKVWTTGTANFARLVDGRIAVQRKDGTIKVYRPQKHIVIPRNPRVGTLIRADKRLKRLTKGLRKVVKG